MRRRFDRRAPTDAAALTIVAAPAPSRREVLAARRELLVATATLQRVRLALAVGLPLARLRARWRGVALLAHLARAWLAPRGAAHWRWWGRLWVLLRRLLGRPRPPD